MADPEQIPIAVEEFLRVNAPVTMAREVVEETTIDGCHFNLGEMVMLPFGAAKSDPAVFPRPDDGLIDRAGNRHAAFGLGFHRCIGSHLARLEVLSPGGLWQVIHEFGIVILPLPRHWDLRESWVKRPPPCGKRSGSGQRS